MQHQRTWRTGLGSMRERQAQRRAPRQSSICGGGSSFEGKCRALQLDAAGAALRLRKLLRHTHRHEIAASNGALGLLVAL
ncbi:hypothetical protein ON010_g11655 [Phytophthora cinnamomi]|nr:hypothetical protein ON010_g11655 [Phytophthora cinnamomi]